LGNCFAHDSQDLPEDGAPGFDYSHDLDTSIMYIPLYWNFHQLIPPNPQGPIFLSGKSEGSKACEMYAIQMPVLV
jgi:hypothetical protein